MEISSTATSDVADRPVTRAPGESPGGPGSEREERQCWERWRCLGDEAARATLLRLHMPYAQTVAAVYYGARTHDDVEFADYHQLAAMGLMEAFERFDPGRGIKFRTFAARRMHGAILDGLEQFTDKNQQILLGKRLKEERRQDLCAAILADPEEKGPAGGDYDNQVFRQLAEIGIGLALGFLLEDTGMFATWENKEAPPEVSPHIAYFRQSHLADLQRQAREAVASLRPAEQTVIEAHYLQGISFGEIGKMLGVTKGRVSQLHRQALHGLRRAITAGSACDVSW